MLYSASHGTLQVSMKSGLEGRNNRPVLVKNVAADEVSMKSGLEGRNNAEHVYGVGVGVDVSMKSGLKGRNNGSPRKAALTRDFTSTCELSAPPGPIKPLC